MINWDETTIYYFFLSIYFIYLLALVALGPLGGRGAVRLHPLLVVHPPPLLQGL